MVNPNSEQKDQRDFLLKLFEITFRDESEPFNFKKKTISLFISLILAVIGGVIIATQGSADPMTKFAFLLISGVIIIFLTYLAINTFQSYYHRFLELESIKAKLVSIIKNNLNVDNRVMRDLILDKLMGKIDVNEVKNKFSTKSDETKFVRFIRIVNITFYLFYAIGSFLIVIGLLQFFDCNFSKTTYLFKVIFQITVVISVIMLLISFILQVIFKNNNSKGRKISIILLIVGFLIMLVDFTLFKLGTIEFSPKLEIHIGKNVCTKTNLTERKHKHYSMSQVIYPFEEAETTLVEPRALIKLNDLTWQIDSILTYDSLKLMIISGRADKRNLNPKPAKIFGSNLNLAQARAKFIKNFLFSKIPRLNSSKVIAVASGSEKIGPDVSVFDLAKDRCVTVYTFWYSKIENK